MAKKSSLKIAGIVTLYNPTDEDISNIKTYLRDIDRLYIVDNTEGKSNEKRIPKSNKIEYIFKNENVGVATAMNMGARKAIKEGYKWLLTMDQDTTFKPGVMKKLKEVITKEDMSKVGIVVPWQETKMRLKRVKDEYDYPQTIMTSGNIVNLDVWEEVGGYKDWLFIDGVDLDYSLNIRKHGYIILRVNSVEIDHELGDIVYRKFKKLDVAVSNHSPMRRYYITRNNEYICDMYKNFDPNICWNLIKKKDTALIILLYEKHKIKKIISMIKGYIDYKKGIKGKKI
ncbi:MAG: glycosyltransferase family 2 protein [Bacilli bacterium]|nr:glycosyltransferase family 2 protein [Bacilli bacterium]